MRVTMKTGDDGTIERILGPDGKPISVKRIALEASYDKPFFAGTVEFDWLRGKSEFDAFVEVHAPDPGSGQLKKVKRIEFDDGTTWEPEKVGKV